MRGGRSWRTNKPLLLLGTSDRRRPEFRTGLELGSYRTGDDSVDCKNGVEDLEGASVKPAAGWVDARGVASRSPALEADCLGGELMIMPSLGSCEGGAGVARAGDD